MGGEIGKSLLWRVPFKGAHGECVVFSVPDSKLVFEIIEGIELMLIVKRASPPLGGCGG